MAKKKQKENNSPSPKATAKLKINDKRISLIVAAVVIIVGILFLTITTKPFGRDFKLTQMAEFSSTGVTTQIVDDTASSIDKFAEVERLESGYFRVYFQGDTGKSNEELEKVIIEKIDLVSNMSVSSMLPVLGNYFTKLSFAILIGVVFMLIYNLAAFSSFRRLDRMILTVSQLLGLTALIFLLLLVTMALALAGAFVINQWVISAIFVFGMSFYVLKFVSLIKFFNESSSFKSEVLTSEWRDQQNKYINYFVLVMIGFSTMLATLYVVLAKPYVYGGLIVIAALVISYLEYRYIEPFILENLAKLNSRKYFAKSKFWQHS